MCKAQPSFIVPARFKRHRGTGFVHCDFYTGLRKSDPEVLKRFYRLDWGGWIKRIAGSQKRVWKMQRRVRRKKDYHVFVSGTYAKKFDKMVTAEYREPKYYVDDMYAPYHRRNTLQTQAYVPKLEKTLKALNYPELDSEFLTQRRKLAAAAVKNSGTSVPVS